MSAIINEDNLLTHNLATAKTLSNSKKQSKKVIILYNHPPNYKRCKSSLSSALKKTSFSATFDNNKVQREFLISGNKLKRSIKDLKFIPKIEITQKNENFPKEINSEIVKNDIKIDNSVDQKLKPDPEILQTNKNQEILNKLNTFEEKDLLSETYQISKEYIPNSTKELNFEGLEGRIPQDLLKSPEIPLIVSKDTKESLETFKEILEIPQKTAKKETFIEPSSFKERHSCQEFYELKEQNFRNYKYRCYEKELHMLENKALAKNKIIGGRWFPTIENIIEEASQGNDLNSNTFDKLREEYFLWKQKLINSKNKPQNEEITQEKAREFPIFKRNIAKTPDFQMGYKPKTSDAAGSKTQKSWFLFEEMKYNARKIKNDSIHEAKEGEKIVCGFKRNFSTKFNEIHQEFQRLLASENMEKHFEIIGFRKNIEKTAENKKYGGKIVKGNSFAATKFVVDRVDFKNLLRSYKVLNEKNEKLNKKIQNTLKINKEGVDFHGFMRFYEIFVRKPPNLEKINEFMLELLKPKELNLTKFLQNFKLLLSNIQNREKRQDIYLNYLNLLSDWGIVNKEKKELVIENLNEMVINNQFILYELFEIICINK